MAYVKATSVLPKELLEEIQKYIQGETIYIPKQTSAHKKWGTASGGRKLLDDRNKKIKAQFHQGMNISALAEVHLLSEETIKKIIYTK